MKIMYAITHVNKAGMRTLSRPNQGRNHFETRKAAEDLLRAMLKNNSPETMRQVYGADPRFEVRPVECYDHGDAIGIYFEEIENFNL
jgi:hypothetical protein